jgi:hypothetical protein
VVSRGKWSKTTTFFPYFSCKSREKQRDDERRSTYVAKCTAEGKTKKEIIRCLKRYIARAVYRILASVFLK